MRGFYREVFTEGCLVREDFNKLLYINTLLYTNYLYVYTRVSEIIIN